MKEIIIVLLTAIRAVESANGLDPRAKGNDLQITPICVRDVNRIYGTSYTLKDITDRRRSEEIAITGMLTSASTKAGQAAVRAKGAR